MSLFSYKLSKHQNENYPIFIDKNELISFNKFLLLNFNKVEYSGECIDNTHLKFESIDNLFEYPNHNERKLQKINIECSNSLIDEDAGLSLAIGGSTRETVRYYFRYNSSDWGFRFDDELNKNLKEFQTWYSLFSKYIPNILVYFVTMLIFMFFYVDLILGITNPVTKIEVAFKVIFPLLICFLIYYTFSKFTTYLFPKSFISLGKQIKEYKFRQKVSYFLFGIVTLTVILELSSSWLYDFLKSF